MAAVLRRGNLFCKKYLFVRTIMSSSSRSQKVMEDLQSNPYYSKYAEKIAELQKTSPEEFMQRIEKKTREKSNQEKKTNTRRYEHLAEPKESRKCTAVYCSKRLSDILKVELVQDKSIEEVKDIWLQYHLQKDVVAASILSDVYNKIKERMAQHPVFLFPLPRSQGYEFFISQVSGDEVHFTTLLCYQVHKENAPECLTLVHYQEFSDKGVILMRGEYDSNVIDGMEAQCLVNQFQMFYGQNHPNKLALLDCFTNHPDSFKHMDLIKELENIEIKLDSEVRITKNCNSET